MDSPFFTSILLILAIITVFLTSFYFPRRRGISKPVRKFKNETETPELFALRMQAYERLILLMERINPTELVLRYKGCPGTVADLQILLLQDVRSETTHNCTQQLYVTDKTWAQIMVARNTVINIINQSAAALDPHDAAVSLAQKIIDNTTALDSLPTDTAIKMLKAELFPVSTHS